MRKEDLIDQLKDCQALQEGHFELSSGYHSNKYVQCMKILQYPGLAQCIAELMYENLKGIDFDVVISPAVGGIVLGFALAAASNKRFIFTERKDGKMILRRSFSLTHGERVVVVDDVVTKGGSVKEVAELVTAHRGQVVAIASLIDRGDKKAFNQSIPYSYLAQIEVESYPPDECPLCKENIAIYSPGSRRLK
ncbi:MAG: orotate phosphoribosyltransferase [Actinomycetota bacterium]|nr:orotate phosphoribosyltransferase [Actinomycetota bacterium]